MELVFEVVDPRTVQRGNALSQAFGEDGGVIGRHPDCTWSIEDTSRLVSGRHAQVVYRNGEYFLIDISRNGIERAQGGLLCKGEEHLIRDGAGFRFGAIDVVARLNASAAGEADWLKQALEPVEARCEAFGADLDPLVAMQEQDCAYGALDGLSSLLDMAVTAQQASDHTPADHDHLLLPRLVPELEPQAASSGSAEQADLSEHFWQQLGNALGIDLQAMAASGREATLLGAALLLRQCIGGLQTSLRNRDELHREIFGGSRPVALDDEASLDLNADAADAIRVLLLQESSCGSADNPVSRSFRQLQSHQVAMLAGARAVTRAALEHFSPQQLNWEFERDSSRPVISSAGSRWRAYLRFHHSLSRTEDWSDDLLARHFAQAYRDQIRLISTLRLDSQG
jgi:type VI secretion system protein ImpI